MNPTTEKPLSKSKQIALVFKALGIDTPAADVIAKLKAEGIEVTPQLVNNVRKRIRDKRTARRQAKKADKVKVVKVTTKAPETPDRLTLALKVKSFAQEVGGLDALEQAIADLRVLAA